MDNPKIIVCDCDGVLTDGKFWLSGSGDTSKGFNTRDVRAIKELISYGYEFWIVTASSWPGMEYYAQKTGAEIFVMRDKAKLNLQETDYIAIGDDVWDKEILKNAYLAFCPNDADISITHIKNMIRLKTNGGQGCIAELANFIRPVKQ